MMLYMTHPQHGAMHVYAEAEAIANEKNGWVREVKTEPVVQPITEELPAASPVVADATLITLPTKRGPGRPKKE